MRVTKILLTSILFIFGEACQGSKLVEKAFTESNELVTVFLQVNNLRDGIEFLGGPFSLKNYAVKVISISKSDNYIRFEYSYKRPLGIPGEPNSFEVRYEQISEPLPLNTCADTSSGEAKKAVSGEFSIEEMDAIRQCVTASESKEFNFANPPEVTIATIDKDDNWVRQKPPLVNIHSVKRLSPGFAQVLVNPCFDKLLHNSYADILVEKLNGKWKLMYPLNMFELRFGKCQTSSRRQRFLLFSEISDGDLRQISKLIETMPGAPPISSVDALKNTVFISFGQEGLELPFASTNLNQPRMLLRLQKQGSVWKVITKVIIEEVFPDWFREGRLFYRKPNPNHIAAVKKKLLWAEHWFDPEPGTRKRFSEHDFLQICEIALRARGFEFGTNVFIFAAKNEREVMVYPADSGDYIGWAIYLRKASGSWVVATEGIFEDGAKEPQPGSTKMPEK
ncbi:MAG: hypothetical protein ACYS6W_03435 [Planctomycetota bacterium]|jgi:hypothetical protein